MATVDPRADDGCGDVADVGQWWTDRACRPTVSAAVRCAAVITPLHHVLITPAGRNPCRVTARALTPFALEPVHAHGNRIVGSFGVGRATRSPGGAGAMRTCGLRYSATRFTSALLVLPPGLPYLMIQITSCASCSSGLIVHPALCEPVRADRQVQSARHACQPWSCATARKPFRC